MIDREFFWFQTACLRSAGQAILISPGATRLNAHVKATVALRTVDRSAAFDSAEDCSSVRFFRPFANFTSSPVPGSFDTYKGV
jgi:hypothetical protein